jgi:hypothetical protein
VQHVFRSVAGVQLPQHFPTKTFKEVAHTAADDDDDDDDDDAMFR